MSAPDRAIGIGLVVLGLAVLASAGSFPDVPGQKVGAGFLPMLVGAGLLLCGLALVRRGQRATHAASSVAPGVAEQALPAVGVVGAIVAYIALADRLGFLIVAPLLLVGVFRALRVAWPPAIAWALSGTLVVHLAFYKLLRVPLPWGVLRPFY